MCTFYAPDTVAEQRCGRSCNPSIGWRPLFTFHAWITTAELCHQRFGGPVHVPTYTTTDTNAHSLVSPRVAYSTSFRLIRSYTFHSALRNPKWGLHQLHTATQSFHSWSVHAAKSQYSRFFDHMMIIKKKVRYAFFWMRVLTCICNNSHAHVKWSAYVCMCVCVSIHACAWKAAGVWTCPPATRTLHARLSVEWTQCQRLHNVSFFKINNKQSSHRIFLFQNYSFLSRICSWFGFTNPFFYTSCALFYSLDVRDAVSCHVFCLSVVFYPLFVWGIYVPFLIF